MPITTARRIDEIRRMASNELDQARRGELGQFMTPSNIADFMASLFQHWPKNIRLLDPGAGVGSLSEAFIATFLKKVGTASQLDITGYEIEGALGRYFQQHLNEVEEQNIKSGHFITHTLIEKDFIVEASFAAFFGVTRYTHIILNPPYKKIAAHSEHRKLLHKLGVEVPNLYVAFLALSLLLAENGGEIVAIIPRSFCNGTYFRPFREWLFKHAAITHIHVFESRNNAFQDDNVLQENVIIRLVRGIKQEMVILSNSTDATFQDYTERTALMNEVVQKEDSEKYIRIPGANTHESTDLFQFTLHELGLDVATGPVVDFRVKEFCFEQPDKNTAPLLYTHHFAKGQFQWPRAHKKPNAIKITPVTKKLLMPKGYYVITKRFSSKEEKRRLVAHVVNPEKIHYDFYGFENHLNVIHAKKSSIDIDLAHGLWIFLNSTLVDNYFRTFSGHTQVNATDLRTMRFPTKEILFSFGKWARVQNDLNQVKIDRFIESYVAK